MIRLRRSLTQLYIRYQLWRLRRVYGYTEWVASLPLILTLTRLLPSSLLMHYTHTLGRQIPITVCFSDCAYTLDWLSGIAKIIETKRYVPDSYLLPFLDTKTDSLDVYLTNRVGGSVSPDLYCARLHQQLNRIDAALAAHDTHYRDYYLRKLRQPINDLFVILEGLLIVALNV